MRVRLLLFVAVLLVAVVTLFLLLLATDTAMSVWQRLSLAPVWLQLAYGLGLVLVSSATLWSSWRWLKPADKKIISEVSTLDSFGLQENVVESASEGVDVSSAVSEIKEQQRRKQSGEVYIAIFGEISSGKSSRSKHCYRRQILKATRAVVLPRISAITAGRRARVIAWSSLIYRGLTSIVTL